MRAFIDTNTQQLWSFDDDVLVIEEGGTYAFETAAGMRLTAVPSTLEPYVAPPPTASQIAAQEAAVLAAQAQAALAAGLKVSSTSTPALNGTYAVDALSQMDIIAIETSLNAGKGFPGGSTTFGYPDCAGVQHAFTESAFTDFAAAVRDYVYGIRAVISGAATTLPASSVAIS